MAGGGAEGAVDSVPQVPYRGRVRNSQPPHEPTLTWPMQGTSQSIIPPCWEERAHSCACWGASSTAALVPQRRSLLLLAPQQSSPVHWASFWALQPAAHVWEWVGRSPTLATLTSSMAKFNQGFYWHIPNVPFGQIKALDTSLEKAGTWCHGLTHPEGWGGTEGLQSGAEGWVCSPSFWIKCQLSAFWRSQKASYGSERLCTVSLFLRRPSKCDQTTAPVTIRRQQVGHMHRFGIYHEVKYQHPNPR